MFWPLAVILLAVAGFSAIVVIRRAAGPRDQDQPGLDPDQLKGFVFVGAAALAVLAVVVVVVGLVNGASGKAEALAVLGFLAYGVYLATAVGIVFARRP